MTQDETPKPPDHLGESGRQLWVALHEDYEILDADSIALLETACVCADRLAQARQIIAEEGPIARDRYNSPKMHPAMLVEKDARAGLIQSLKALDLDPGA